MMKDRLAIFDLDGTLFDTRRVNYESYKYALSKFGIDLPFEGFWEKLNGRHYKLFLPILMGSDEHIEEAHDIKVEKYSEFLSTVVPNDSLFAMIDCMKDEFHIALVSTATYENVHQVLDYFGYKDKFELILTQRDVENKKPDPEGFIKAMDYFSVSPDRTIVFEDSEVGIEAAKRAGCVTYIVKGYS